MSIALQLCKQPEKSLGFILKSVDIWKQLVKAVPGKYDINLSTSLRSLADAYRQIDQIERALTVAQEAVGICEELALIGAAENKAEWSRALSTLANVHFTQKLCEKSAGSTPLSSQPPTPSAIPKATAFVSPTRLMKNASCPLAGRFDLGRFFWVWIRL